MAAHDSRADSLRFCDRQAELNATQQDTRLRLGALVKAELDRSGQGLALISRSGLDLARFGVRYSHAGLSLKASRNTPWSVRQLYFACDERRPRLYDQGMAGFLLGTDDPAIGYVSIVLLPSAHSVPLEQAALDDRQALRLLGERYSANAFPFNPRYQNCNQWVLELMAVAWGGLAGTEAGEGSELRARAQQWLMAQGYSPTLFDVGSRWLMWFGNFVPWLHSDDHPSDAFDRLQYRVSMPASIEDFVRARVPGATRVEFCHTERHIVVRRGWAPIAPGCVPEGGDTVVRLDASDVSDAPDASDAVSARTAP